MGGAVAILGLGNVLMGDDALGPWIIERLRARWRFPEQVEVEDLGTPGLDLLPHLAGRRSVILVDTVRADGSPGEVRTYGMEDILAHAPGPRVSPHDPGLRETLGSLRFAGNAPRTMRLVGVIPDRVEHGTGLSEAVRSALPVAERTVLLELARLGHVASPRPDAEPARPWWEAASFGSGARLR